MEIVLGIICALLISGEVLAQDGACPSTGMQPFDYAQALCMSSLFYEAQRSGYLPPEQRVTWRGDSALGDGSDVGLDLVGGYFDAGDFVKFGFPGAYTVTALAWGLIAFPSGYSATGQTDYARAAIKWGSDYLLKAHTGPTEFWGQVGDGDIDHSYWGRPEEMTMARPSAKIDAAHPGSDLAAEAAAALAATSIIFRDIDSAYADQCLQAARELFAFADQYRGLYHESITGAASFYNSYSYDDELAWGALWMFKATYEDAYIIRAKEIIDEFGIMNYAQIMDWNAKQPGIYAMLAEIDGAQYYMDKLKEYVDHIIFEQQHTPLGLVYIGPWGSLRLAMNVAFIAMRAAFLGIDTQTYQSWAEQQVNYALGSTGRSFVVGFGVNPPTHPHHRSSSCPDPPAICDNANQITTDPNPHVLYGALVGGPDENDVYADDRLDYVKNEVTIDYNALFTGLLSSMVEIRVRETFME